MASRLAVAALAALSATAVPAVIAQMQPASSPPSPPPSPPAASQPAARPAAQPATAAPLRYRSAFEGYRGHADAPVQPWRESNDQVGRIGGWKAYVREAQGQAPDGAAAAAGATPRTGNGATPSPSAGAMPPTGTGAMPPTGSGAMPHTGSGAMPPTGSGATPPKGAGEGRSAPSPGAPGHHHGHRRAPSGPRQQP